MTSPRSKKSFFCPDCGAFVAAGADHCPNGHGADNTGVTHSDPNFAEGDVGSCLVTLLIIVLTLVAAGIAFFLTCAGMVMQGPSLEAVFGTSAIAAGIVVVIGIGILVRFLRGPRKKRNSPPPPGDSS